MRAWPYDASPDAVGELLDGGGEFVEPAVLLSDLTEEQVHGGPRSLAAIVAHMHFWQEHTLAGLEGRPSARPERLEDSFTPPPPGAWDALVADFLAGIERAKTLARSRADTLSPHRDDTSLCYDLAESALHNAYHLGQIALIRQQRGLWPPAGGDKNDY